MTGDGVQREVGGYRLLRRIGAGGMGTVHEAVDADGRRVALKLLHPHIGADPQARKRLSREVALLHRVRETGVARVLDAEVEDAEAFVVTELIEGPTLEEDVAEDGPFTPTELATLAHGLAGALRAIHAVGVVHRDFKPGNVMMSENGPVIIDFGIAQVADDARLTQTGMVTGTPGYLDPEVIAGAEPSPVCDWWGWAAVLVFAATGRPPFGRGPTGVVLARVATGQADTEGLDPVVARALRAALHPDPAQRLGPDGVLAVLDGQWGDDKLTQMLHTTGLAAGALAAGGVAGDGAAAQTTAMPDGARQPPAVHPFQDGTRAAAGSTAAPEPGTSVLPTSASAPATAAPPADGAWGAGTVASGVEPPTRAIPAEPPTRALPAEPATRALPIEPATRALPAAPPVMPESYPPRPSGQAGSSAGQVVDPRLGDPAQHGTRAGTGYPSYPVEHGYPAGPGRPGEYGQGGFAGQGGFPGQEAYPGQGGFPGQEAYPGQGGFPERPPTWAFPARRRTLVVGTVGLGVSAVATAFPGAFLVVAAVLLVLTAATGWAGRSRRAARLRRGPRSGDDARMLAGLPWHLLRGVLSSVPGALVGATVGAATWWFLTALADPPQRPFPLWAAAVLALLAAWFTPSSKAAREGARAMVEVLTPTRGFRALLVVLVLAVVAVLAFQAMVAPAPPSWAPLPGPPPGF